MNQSIQEIKEQLKNEFSSLKDSDEKWSKLIKIAREVPEIPEDLKEDKFLISGCASRLYLIPAFNGSTLELKTDVDRGPDTPTFVRGLGAIAIKVYSGQSPQAILDDFTNDPEFFKTIGLTSALSATRANGFGSLLKQIFMYAQVFAKMTKGN
jgi:cysteine desulfuration protein SufE